MIVDRRWDGSQQVLATGITNLIHEINQIVPGRSGGGLVEKGQERPFSLGGGYVIAEWYSGRGLVMVVSVFPPIPCLPLPLSAVTKLLKSWPHALTEFD